MTTEEHESDQPEEEAWVEIEGVEDIPVPVGPTDSEEEAHAFGRKPSARPWIVSLNTAIVGMVLSLLIVALPEIREFRFNNGTVLHTGYISMPIPIMALVWGVICMAHSEHKKNWRTAIGAIFLATLSAALLAYTATIGNATQGDQGINSDSTRSLEMNEEELKTWRDEKLKR